MIEHLIKYKPPWIAESKHLEIHKFTDDEEEALLKLPRKQYILGSLDCYDYCCKLIYSPHS